MNPSQTNDSLASAKLTQLSTVRETKHTISIRRLKIALVDAGTRSVHVFEDPVVTIGSHPDNDLVLKENTVSRYHCRISQTESGFVIRDLDSTNGTTINGVHIREAYLEPGLLVKVAEAQLRFSTFDEEFVVEPSLSEKYGRIVGRSVAMREIFSVIDRIAPTNATVIIEGETGTGKEVVARTIHEKSKRSEQPYVVFDCSAVPESLIESELFGHEKGAFTGAVSARKGLFEQANGGTLFLDELGELSPHLQPKLLRVLEQRCVRRVGANELIPVNVRLIAATNRNLREEVREGTFRKDLYYRLSVIRIELPPLRERTQDIALLANHFLLKSFNLDENEKQRVKGLTPEAVKILEAYPWPGNVRELVNTMEHACSFASSMYITDHDLPARVKDPELWTLVDSKENQEKKEESQVGKELKSLPFKEAKALWLERFEREYIIELLEKNDWNISASAREADLNRKYFRALMHKYDIEAEG